MKTIVDVEKSILEKLVCAYEKKGGAEASVAAVSVYRRYKAIDEPVQNIEWFEEAVRILQQKELVHATWKKDEVSRLRLNTSMAEEAAQFLGRKLSLKQDGRTLLENDGLHPSIDTSYYAAHPSDYVKERKDVLALSSYLYFTEGKALHPVSRRERAFEIWQEEKTFSQGSGSAVLAHCDISEASLCIYETYEPIPYRSFTRDTPQNVLFVENSATYGTLLKMASGSGVRVFGKDFGTIVFSAGDRILAQIAGWNSTYIERHLLDPADRFYYFGDLDLSGIRIFLALKNAAPFDIVPLRSAYISMADKMSWYEKNMPGRKTMPKNQYRNEIGGFSGYFEKEEWERISSMLGKGYLVPQEILTAKDFAK